MALLGPSQLTFLYSLIVVSKTERIDRNVFGYCDEYHAYVDIIVDKDEEIYLKTGANDQSSENLSCSVVLESSDVNSDLFYQFHSFSTLPGFFVSVLSKYTSINSKGAIYRVTHHPSLYLEKHSNAYLKVITDRHATTKSWNGISFVIKVYRKEKYTETTTQFTTPYVETRSSTFELTVGAVLGIVMGAVGFIIITIVVVVCVARSVHRRGGGQATAAQPVSMQSQLCRGQPYTNLDYRRQHNTSQLYRTPPYIVGERYPMYTYPIEDLQGPNVESPPPTTDTIFF